MSLSALIRKRDSISVSAATPATVATLERGGTGSVARVATVAVAKSPEPKTDTASYRWLIHFTDRDPLEVATTPASSHTEVLTSYPDAIAAEPLAPSMWRPPASMGNGDEEAIRAWLEHLGEADAATVADVLRQCQQDAEVRRYYVGRAAAARVAGPRSCVTCRDFARPGLSVGYCGGERADLLPAYGVNHPLRQLPEDGGASCDGWALHARRG